LSGERTDYIGNRSRKFSYVLEHVRLSRFRGKVNKNSEAAMEGIMARTVKSIEEIGAVALEVNEPGRSQGVPQDTSIVPSQYTQHASDRRSY
jgi:hypothetical protein